MKEKLDNALGLHSLLHASLSSMGVGLHTHGRRAGLDSGGPSQRLDNDRCLGFLSGGRYLLNSYLLDSASLPDSLR